MTPGAKRSSSTPAATTTCCGVRSNSSLPTISGRDAFSRCPPFCNRVIIRTTTNPNAPGTLIGPYRLRELIGEGGMGMVYLAEQEDAGAPTVALKIIKPGMDTRRSLRAFEAERQALAMMDHPYIARVLGRRDDRSRAAVFRDGTGRGIPITDYCDADQLRADASGWSCSSRSARRFSMRIRRGSSTGTSSRRTCW